MLIIHARGQTGLYKMGLWEAGQLRAASTSKPTHTTTTLFVNIQPYQIRDPSFAANSSPACSIS